MVDGSVAYLLLEFVARHAYGVVVGVVRPTLEHCLAGGVAEVVNRGG
jgi:hypothetical protein